MKTIGRLLLISGWFFLALAPGGAEYGIGSWGTQARCRDFLGSALYRHPPACHKRPSLENCRALGPSVAVQAGWAFSEDCLPMKGFGFFPHQTRE